MLQLVISTLFLQRVLTIVPAVCEAAYRMLFYTHPKVVPSLFKERVVFLFFEENRSLMGMIYPSFLLLNLLLIYLRKVIGHVAEEQLQTYLDGTCLTESTQLAYQVGNRTKMVGGCFGGLGELSTPGNVKEALFPLYVFGSFNEMHSSNHPI